MSRVGKNPIPIPDKTKVDIAGKKVSVTGPLGTLTREIHPEEQDNLYRMRPGIQDAFSQTP